MAQFLNYNASVVTPVTDGVQIPIPVTPAGVGLALVNVEVPSSNNLVEVKATIGVRGNTGTGSILFRIFRDGKEIYYAREGIESGFEKFATLTLQAIDSGVTAGLHGYQVSAEILTAGLSATVIGPLNISATVYGL